MTNDVCSDRLPDLPIVYGLAWIAPSEAVRLRTRIDRVNPGAEAEGASMPRLVNKAGGFGWRHSGRPFGYRRPGTTLPKVCASLPDNQGMTGPQLLPQFMRKPDPIPGRRCRGLRRVGAVPG